MIPTEILNLVRDLSGMLTIVREFEVNIPVNFTIISVI